LPGVEEFFEIGAKKGSRKPTTPAGPTCTVPGAFMFSYRQSSATKGAAAA
jgi:hypothetical protein